MHACNVFPFSARLFKAMHWWSLPRNPTEWMLMTGSLVLRILISFMSIPVAHASGFAGTHRMPKEAAKMCKRCMKPSLAVAWFFVIPCMHASNSKNHTHMHTGIHVCKLVLSIYNNLLDYSVAFPSPRGRFEEDVLGKWGQL